MVGRKVPLCAAQLALTLGAGCGGGLDTETGVWGSGETTAQGSDGSTSGESGDAPTSSLPSTADTPGEATGDGVKFDTPEAESGETLGDGCSKVDFLFIVDNSGSMGDEQQNLSASFPGFIETIVQTTEVQDFHIMVVTTGLGDYQEELLECHEDCMDPDEEDCGLPDADYACSDLPPLPPSCDIELGAGQTDDATTPPTSCGIDGGDRFMSDQQTDLSTTFQCLALVGTDGDGSEQPIEAMLAASGEDLSGPGGCNDGFVRDDAVLVITIITDEESVASGTPATWRADVLAAKGGNETAVVVLGLVGDPDLPGSPCPPPGPFGVDGAEPSPRLRGLVDGFGPRGVLGSVCEPDYGPFFEAAVEVIDFACEEFTPEG